MPSSRSRKAAVAIHTTKAFVDGLLRRFTPRNDTQIRNAADETLWVGLIIQKESNSSNHYSLLESQEGFK